MAQKVDNTSMVNVLQNFEQASGQFNPLILIGPGAAAVVLGLIVWIAGVSFRRWVLAVVGCLIGCICGVFVIEFNPLPAAAFAGAGAAAGAIFQRLFVAILAAILATAIVSCVLARPYVGDARLVSQAKDEETLSWAQSVRVVESFATDFDAGLEGVCSKMPVYKWAILAATAAAGLVGGFLFWRTASALCFATLGPMLIFAGIILLLLYKGSTAISSILYRPSFYAIVFGAMTAFGAVVQLILCKQKKKESTKAGGADKDGGESPSGKKKDWRTS